jgi:Flp pilus assembly protein TadD
MRPGLALVLAAALMLEGCAGAVAPDQGTQAAAPDAASTLRIARAARAAGDYASAVNLYRTLAAAGAGGPAVTAELGDTLLEAGSIDDAIETYKSLPRNSPAALRAMLGLEHAYLMLGDLAQASSYADKARAIAPDDPRALVDRGIVLDLTGRHAEAQKSYRAVLAKLPGHRAARVDLALSLALTGQYDEAEKIIDPIARSSNSTVRERQNLALIYGLMGNRAEAQKWSRMDLSEAAAAGNLRFFDFIRAPSP